VGGRSAPDVVGPTIVAATHAATMAAAPSHSTSMRPATGSRPDTSGRISSVAATVNTAPTASWLSSSWLRRGRSSMREMISAYALFAIPIAQPMSNDASKKTGATNASRSSAAAMHEVRTAMVAAAVSITAF